ncbi:hypothetical protein [Pararhizobium haloflavum]|uniref:hypothetical protein n=1 Tax=Pararhizobium haloflavum TaxID=2037914 RepID=UPI0012FFEA37|nr:hypothetical protein [Pararhizobium haloflavum]
MTTRQSDGFVRMPDAEFEAILTRAAEEGAKRNLAPPFPALLSLVIRAACC